MPELGVVLHGRVDVEDAGFADEGVGADVNAPGVNAVRLRLVAEDDRVLPEDGVGADGDEIGAPGHEGRVDDGVGADLGAEQPQVEAVEGPTEPRHGCAADEAADGPEAEVAETPDRDTLL